MAVILTSIFEPPLFLEDSAAAADDLAPIPDPVVRPQSQGTVGYTWWDAIPECLVSRAFPNPCPTPKPTKQFLVRELKALGYLGAGY